MELPPTTKKREKMFSKMMAPTCSLRIIPPMDHRYPWVIRGYPLETHGYASIN